MNDLAPSSSAAPHGDVPFAHAAALTTVVIVTADSGDGVGDCIARVLASTAAVEVIIVDNDSHDGALERIAARFGHNPQLRIVQNGTNLGFGAACNRGAAIASGDALLFLNPDCLIDAQTIAQLRACLETDTHIGVAGALQVDAGGNIDPASRRRDPLLLRAFMSLSGLARFGASAPAFAGVALPWPDAGIGAVTVEPVDAISGALMLLPRAAFVRIGGFDEGYFLHCEDLDLCRRVRDTGLAVVCADAVRVVHGKGGSSRHRPLFVAWHKHRGMWRWFRKFDPAARNPLLRVLVWCGLWTLFALRVPLLLWRVLVRARTL